MVLFSAIFFENDKFQPRVFDVFEINHIAYSYSSQRVIDDISLIFESGKFHAILGPNGSGKTTFVDLLIGNRKPGAGSIVYNGKSLPAFSKKELAKEMALVPQNYHINFPFTAEEIIMMGRYPHIPRFSQPSARDFHIVEDILKQTKTAAFRNRYITELSGGERQRVVFARALAQNTPVLLLDEGTSNLDIQYTLALLNLVQQKIRDENATVIAVMQNMNLAALYSDDMVFLKEGKVVAFGSTDETLTPGIIGKVFGVESKVIFDAYAGSKQVILKK